MLLFIEFLSSTKKLLRNELQVGVVPMVKSMNIIYQIA